VTTQHDYEENDVETTVVEEAPALENLVAPATIATTASGEVETNETEAQAVSTPADVAPPTETHEEGHTDEPARSVAEFPAAPEGQQQEQDEEKESEKANQSFEAAPYVETQEEVRPFTAFIEEFREAEARFSAALQESREEAFKLLSPTEGDLSAPAELSPALDTLVLPDGVSENEQLAEPLAAAPEAAAAEEVPAPALEAERQPVISEQAEETGKDTAVEEKTEKAAPAARAVSPLLRPPSRVRMPRHSSRHQREGSGAAAETPSPETAATSEPAPAAAETPVEPETPRPARRYRFDRPAATAASAQPAPSRAEASQVASEQVTGAQAKSAGGTQSTSRQSVAQEQVPEESASATTPAAPESGRRRSGSERQKEQAAAPAPANEAAASVTEATDAQGNVAPEDLPPLEYSELQKVASRRRRRHRSSSSNGAAATTPSATPTPLVMPTPPAPAAPTNSTNGAAASAPYTIVSGYTVNQMNQGNEATGPFMAPEPSPARGSVFTGRTIGRAETQRPQAPPHTVTRHTEAGPSAASMNYFANMVAQAIQTQTDRMVAELRRASQAPTSVSVSLPPFPSTERVGVFVDVANLLYSARTLRIAVDFGKLLDFLRGNRRLVRAHAYCPTSPQPGDEQMFLQAVKGLGYRITTKNYKTFSSGAKKADLDLDLCMDVVRLVDGRAVDCIVLVSGDSDFMPMLDYCSDHGVRVEVAAFDEAMSATLRQSCDLFINLSMLEEIRA
jgi:uncharacterized LabA/DUF88 family protein